MQGVPVRGTISDIPELVRKYHIVEIIIAITTLKGERLNEVINLCNSTIAACGCCLTRRRWMPTASRWWPVCVN